MPSTTATGGLPIPAYSDQPDVVGDMQRLAAALDLERELHFDDAADRDAVLTSDVRVDGMRCYLGDQRIGQRWNANINSWVLINAATRPAYGSAVLLGPGGNTYDVSGSAAGGGLSIPEFDWTFVPTRDGPAWLTVRFDLLAISPGFGAGLHQVTLGRPGPSVSGWIDAVARDGIPNWADDKVVRFPVQLQLVKNVAVTLGLYVKAQTAGGHWGIASVQYKVQQAGS